MVGESKNGDTLREIGCTRLPWEMKQEGRFVLTSVEGKRGRDKGLTNEIDGWSWRGRGGAI